MKNYFVNFLSALLLISCSNDIEKEETSLVLDSRKMKASLVDGRLHFNSLDDFKNSIEYLKTLKDEEVEAIMYEYYDEGFMPLYPFYKEEDEVLIREFVEKKKDRLNQGSIVMRTDESIVEDDEIGDDDPEAYVEPDDDLIR
ncbi:hypothetical protein M0M57_05970 [Flavobacterium azooxidireducens]|uniref:DUF4296 domain-containing protein n=1 Tax=Flavobacterium azooxidireducens TaxID=1871076 RepID=A0ABY4KKU0_9FLAO|nr:hypothetical protein [Flavobacterium azooxidireducens]UPQ80383.1 hypothetical protein M0M57_05970 [Flavobacterium azooxidireducens]